MTLPIYFRFIFQKLFTLFFIIHLSLVSGYFCLELLMHSSLARSEQLFFHFLNLSLLRSDLLITLSFLLAAIHTLQTLKQHGELVALQVSGISKKALTLPFFTVALLLALFSYWNIEWGIPKTLSWTKHAQTRKKAPKELPFKVEHLQNQNRIIYQKEGSHIFDLYWISSEKEIWHCKEVLFENDHFVGYFVDQLKKNALGRFEKANSFPTYRLPFSIQETYKKNISSENASLTKIIHTLSNESLLVSSDRAKFLTSLLYKLVYPWFPLLFMTGILAFLFSSKQRSSYLAFITGIFFYLLFYSMMKTFIILGENYVVSPWITLIFIPLGIQSFFSYKLCKK